MFAKNFKLTPTRQIIPCQSFRSYNTKTEQTIWEHPAQSEKPRGVDSSGHDKTNPSQANDITDRRSRPRNDEHFARIREEKRMEAQMERDRVASMPAEQRAEHEAKKAHAAAQSEMLRTQMDSFGRGASRRAKKHAMGSSRHRSHSGRGRQRK